MVKKGGSSFWRDFGIGILSGITSTVLFTLVWSRIETLKIEEEAY